MTQKATIVDIDATPKDLRIFDTGVKHLGLRVYLEYPGTYHRATINKEEFTRLMWAPERKCTMNQTEEIRQLKGEVAQLKKSRNKALAVLSFARSLQSMEQSYGDITRAIRYLEETCDDQKAEASPDWKIVHAPNSTSSVERFFVIRYNGKTQFLTSNGVVSETPFVFESYDEAWRAMREGSECTADNS